MEPSPAMLEIVLDATRCLEREGCVGALAQGLLSLAGGSSCLGYLASPSGEDLECCAAAGEGAARLRQALAVIDAGLVRHLVPSGPSVIAEADVLLPTGEEDALPPLGAALIVPLRAAAGQSGVLLLILAPGESPGPATLAIAEALAREAAPALGNLRMIESLRELAIRDDTADCFNRRYLDQSLDDEVERSRRFGGKFAAIFLDMDNLKEINTRFGHAAGSRVLYQASVRIGRSVRLIDRVYRYGGDEFVVILPGTSLQGAREAAERIRRELASQPFEVGADATAVLTASLGVGAWPEHGPTGRNVVEACDAAMRRIKESSKNAVGVADEAG